ncbi:hypothetical protein TSOC_001588 [Tetrabaena socialis]|uniref:Uncharacterized protein n=1 Tax=Tetrabaena socialis TaxID=47790 RepID=A0A2J8AG77_9CHLO|nr:hypothetical protein TSOC_001588 [Tetrabaena socialis]|eukprot:PNH11524.1 hypothetical protein TSOC_001588 [Tetrabaena socialis]
MLAAVGSVLVDLSGTVAGPSGGGVEVAAFKDRDGTSYGLLQESGQVARQLVAVCPANQEYLIHSVGPNGIGGAIHVTGVALLLALDTERLFIEAPGTFLASGPECSTVGGGKHTMDSCFFLPFAGCEPTVEQLKGGVHATAVMVAGGEGGKAWRFNTDAAVVFSSHDALIKVRANAPQRFQARLSGSPLQPSKHYYWWRAQPPPNDPTNPNRANRPNRLRRTLSGPPPSRGCISIHVRHGDKGIEAEVFDNARYDKVAAGLRALDPVRFSDRVFVSTEDPDTVEYFANQTGGRWRASFTAGVPRKPDRSRTNLQYMAEIGYYEEMLNSLLNLELALECWGFVGSIYSNWVRLIDELRSTLRCKADAVFADIRYANPHEMDTNW